MLQLNEVLRAYQVILDDVESQLASIGLSATTRVKTRGVLIEKLKREQGMALARVQDMAGARTVVTGGWAKQDEVVEQLTAHFNSWERTTQPARVVDRRARPSHGYRAVHVIVFPDSVPVEIQVRTELQNYWAQIVERLADRWGRGIRYGEDADDADLPAEGVRHSDGSPVTRREIIDDLRTVFAPQIAAIEDIELDIHRLTNAPREGLEEILAKYLQRDVEDLEVDAVRCYPRMRREFKKAVVVLWRSGALVLKRGQTPVHRRARRQVGRFLRRLVPDITPSGAEFVRQRHRQCDLFVRDMVEVQRSRLEQQQATLRARLRSLGQYVEQGGIR